MVQTFILGLAITLIRSILLDKCWKKNSQKKKKIQVDVINFKVDILPMQTPCVHFHIVFITISSEKKKENILRLHFSFYFIWGVTKKTLIFQMRAPALASTLNKIIFFYSSFFYLCISSIEYSFSSHWRNAMVKA